MLNTPVLIVLAANIKLPQLRDNLCRYKQNKAGTLFYLQVA
jgi:hypothetical protein